MRALLDTHAFLWYSTDDPSLSARADELIANPANEILLSVASLWEIAIKVSIGKLILTRSFEEAVLAQMSRNGIRLLDVQVRHIQEILDLPAPSPRSVRPPDRRTGARRGHPDHRCRRDSRHVRGPAALVSPALVDEMRNASRARSGGVFVCTR